MQSAAHSSEDHRKYFHQLIFNFFDLFTRSALRARTACTLLAVASALAHAEQPRTETKFPYPEKLEYRAEWRLVTAGTAAVQLSRETADDWQIKLDLESAGFVNRLFRVLDKYTIVTNDDFCADRSVLDAQEGKRHKLTRMTFENSRHKLDYYERDLVRNSTVKKELDIPPCTRDVIGALATLRETNLLPGHSMTLAVTNGTKVANVKVTAQAREKITVAGKRYQTVKYEAFVFDNVLYPRKGRLLLWLSDDADRVPVQLRFQLGFPIGSISLQLEERGKN